MKTNFLRILLCAATLLTSFNLYGQDRYCLTYDDLINDRWDTVSHIKCSGRGIGKQFWVGGSDYTMKTGDKKTDKILKKKALAVIINDSLYVNCLNLRREKIGFGLGYARARLIGNDKIFFVNQLIGRDLQNEAIAAGYFFGAIGSAITASEQRKNQVCYIISEGEDMKGRINIQVVDDEILRELIEDKKELRMDYNLRSKKERASVEYITYILEKGGLFTR